MAKGSTSFFAKYRILLISVGAFFALSISIYAINYFLLVQIASDAARINDSGRMRGLTQQHAKAILALAHEHLSGAPLWTSQAQISESVIGLAEVLARVQARARQTGDEQESEIVAKFEKSWKPLEEISLRLLDEKPATDEVEAARIRSNTTNVRLMQIADDLTSHQEEVAAARARKLKFLQGAAIVVAALIFLFIVEYTFRSLRRSEAHAEAARRETEQILGTVREGLFLIDRDGRIGQQRAAHLDRIFPRRLEPGGNYFEILAPLVSPETMESVRHYVGLLFNDKVKLALVESLNPLDRVEIIDPNRPDQFPIYLSFSFSPVTDAASGAVVALLVSVIDVSQKVYLERELQGAEDRARGEMSLLLGILKNDPGVVSEFLANARLRLDEVNNLLRDVDPRLTGYSEVINQIFRIVHSIKGEAAALALGPVSQEAHAFEEVLTPLRRQKVSGEDLISVATQVGSLQQAIAKVQELAGQITAYASGASAEARTPADDVAHTLQRIQRLALAVAADLNKRVRVETSIEPVDVVPDEVHRLLREGLPQLVRNAVVHGIEPSDERLKSGKTAEGLIRIELKRPSDTHLEITVSDDGRGIDIHNLRSKLVATGRRSAQQVAQMSDQEIIATIFEPGVSTVEAVTEHAGRGVGLDVLLSLVRSTGARLRVASTPSKATRFTLQWSPT